MDDIAPAIALVGVLVFMAHFFTGIFSRTRIPDVLLLIAIGIVLGPIFGLVTPEQFGVVGPIFTSITLIIILFESGTDLKLSVLIKAIGGAMALAFLGFLLTMFIAAGLIVLLTDLGLIPAFILGAIMASTSGVVVIPLSRQLNLKPKTQTMLSIESSVNDVLCVIVVLALIGAYEIGGFEFIAVTGDLIASFVVAIIFGIVGALLWAAILNRIHAIRNTMFTTPAFVFILFGVVEILGFNGAMAALAFGVTIGNLESIRFTIFKKRHGESVVGLNQTERAVFSEVAFLLKTFFFIYLGISLELMDWWPLILGLIFTLVVFVLRLPIVKFTVSKSLPAKDASIMSVMIPKGLVAIVLASIIIQRGIPGGELIRDIIYSLVLISVVFTALFVFVLDKTKLSDYYGRLFLPYEGSRFADYRRWASSVVRKPRLPSQFSQRAGKILRFPSGKKDKA